MRGQLAWGALLFVLGVGGLLFVNNVSVALTREDVDAIAAMTQTTGKPGIARNAAVGQPFEVQIALVRDVQDAVLSVAPKTPVDETTIWNPSREIKDLVRLRRGTCFDRSRAIEKMLSYVGLEVRHASIFATDRQTALAAITTPASTSHAVSEVRTAKGWMVVDSSARWMGLTPEGDPLSLAEIKERTERWQGPWHPFAADPPFSIFRRDFSYVLGLYSRHGRFYPPNLPLPDVNWRQLAANLTD